MASRRGPLSKAEIFYVTEHAKSGTDINIIASDLDRPIKSIQKCFTKAKKDNEAKPLTAGDQFARHNGTVVMTENAATLADARRKIRVPQKAKDCITQVKQSN